MMLSKYSLLRFCGRQYADNEEGHEKVKKAVDDIENNYSWLTEEI